MMILVVGAAASGKLDYVRSLGYGSESISDGFIGDAPVVANLQNLVAADPATAPNLFDELSKKEVVVCDEVGSGIIPISREQREAREATGRLCNRLATVANKVVRLVCGIPVVIKE